MTWEKQETPADLTQMPERVLQSFIESAERAVARFPHSSRARTDLGIALLKNFQPADAVDVLRVAVELDPSDRLAELTLADAFFYSGNSEAASNIYSRLAKHGLLIERATLGLAALAFRRNTFEAAREVLVPALKTVKDSAELWFLLGMVELKAGNTNNAIHALRAATRLGNRNPVFHHSLGVVYAVAKNYKSAVLAFRTALALLPGCLDTVHALGRVLIDSGELAHAVEILALQVQDNPNDQESRHLLARAYAGLGKHPAAQSNFTRLLQTSDNVSVDKRISLLNGLAVSFMEDNKIRDAELALKKAITIGAHISPIPYDNLGRVYLYHLEQPEQAAEVLGKARALFPESQSTAVLFAISLKASDEPRKAVLQLVPFLEKGVADESIYICLGWLYGEMSDSAKAISVLSEGLRRFPENDGIINNLAYTYLMEGDIGHAAEVLGPFSDNTSNPELVATYGLLSFWQNEEQVGRERYKKAATMAGGDSHKLKRIKQKLHLELARLYLRRCERERARKELSLGLAMRDFPLSFKRELLALSASF